MAASPMACARWLLPLPGGPTKSESSWRAMKAAVARSKTKLRFILGLKVKSTRFRADDELYRTCGASRRNSNHADRCGQQRASVIKDHGPSSRKAKRYRRPAGAGRISTGSG